MLTSVKEDKIYITYHSKKCFTNGNVMRLHFFLCQWYSLILFY